VSVSDTSGCALLQALYLLLQCEHNVDKAVQRHRLQSVAPTGFGLFSLFALVTILLACFSVTCGLEFIH